MRHDHCESLEHSYELGASAAGVNREVGSGHSTKGASRASDFLRQTTRRVWTNSVPRFPYHRSPEGTRLVERMVAEGSMV